MLKILIPIVFMLFIQKLFWLCMENLKLLLMIFMISMIPSIYNSIYNFYLMDILSYSLMLLTIFICSLMISASVLIQWNKNNMKLFIIIIIILNIVLLNCLCVFNLLSFYITFEMSLIPTLVLILGWGYQPERVTAGVYLMMYTLLFSLPLLLVLFLMDKMNNNLTYLCSKFLFNSPWWVQVILVIAFLVKMPMFLIHLWLPKAHVEAPISGSMILAGILLKLGGYGLLRIIPLILKINYLLLIYITSISLVGSMLISMKCLNQLDLKLLIAYSSVVHMGLILMNIFNFGIWGWNGSLLMMITHGLCSSGMFYLANITYERIHNRSMLLNKGLLSFMTSLSLWWFLLLSSNMAAPPTMNLLSEISLLNSIVNWSNYSILLLMMISLFSASYCLYLFSMSQHGISFSLMYSYNINYLREYLLLFFHWFPLNILILKSDFFFLWMF